MTLGCCLSYPDRTSLIPRPDGMTASGQKRTCVNWATQRHPSESDSGVEWA